MYLVENSRSYEQNSNKKRCCHVWHFGTHPKNALHIVLKTLVWQIKWFIFYLNFYGSWKKYLLSSVNCFSPTLWAPRKLIFGMHSYFNYIRRNPNRCSISIQNRTQQTFMASIWWRPPRLTLVPGVFTSINQTVLCKHFCEHHYPTLLYTFSVTLPPAYFSPIIPHFL